MTVAVLFDLDGVLVDSFDAWLALKNDAARHFGHPAISAEQFRASFGTTAGDVERFFPSASAARVEAFYEEHFADHVGAIRAVPGASEIIDQLDKRGLLSAVITNAASSTARTISRSIPDPAPRPRGLHRRREAQAGARHDLPGVRRTGR